MSPDGRPPQAMPSASVIVPTRERPLQLVRCLEALVAQDYSGERFEVVVVDDAPAPDGAAGESRAAELYGRFGDRLRLSVVPSEGQGPASARNRGAAVATGELLAFCDDDCLPEPQWLRFLATRIETDPHLAAGGLTVNVAPGPWPAASAAINDAVYEHYDADPQQARFLASNNLALPADSFRRLGGFDEDFPVPGGEDADLCRRWLERGWRMVWERRAVVRHEHGLRIPDFWRQHYRYGRGAYMQRRAGARRGGGFRLRPAITSGIFGLAASRAIEERAPLRLAALLLWQLANATGFASAAIAAGMSRLTRRRRGGQTPP